MYVYIILFSLTPPHRCHPWLLKQNFTFIVLSFCCWFSPLAANQTLPNRQLELCLFYHSVLLGSYQNRIIFMIVAIFLSTWRHIFLLYLYYCSNTFAPGMPFGAFVFTCRLLTQLYVSSLVLMWCTFCCC